MAIARRLLLKRGLMWAAAVCLYKPLSLLAAWPKHLFEQHQFHDVLKNYLDGKPLHESDLITLNLPPISQNGVEVPAKITTKLPGVESIAVMVENNPNPMSAEFHFFGMSQPKISLRLKMNATSPVHVLVKSQGEFYRVTTQVTVRKGGCYISG